MKKDVDCCRPKCGRFHGLGFAILLIVAGIALLCVKLDFIPAKYVDAIISWQSLLIVVGLISLFKRHFIGGLTLIFIGKFFLIPEIGKVPGNFLGNVPPNFIQLYWPVLLIFAGLMFILHRITRPYRKFEYARAKFIEHAGTHHQQNQFECDNGFVKKNSAFASTEHIVLDPEFKGGYIKTVFGETKLDLRKTNLTDDARIDIEIAFGGIVVFVPADWQVQINVNSVFGAFEDKRSFKKEVDSNKTLVIYGSLVFGGGEIRN